MSEESTRKAIEDRAAEIAAEVGEQPVIGATDAFHGILADTARIGAEAQALADAKIKAMSRADWLRVLDQVSDAIVLVPGILARLGVPGVDTVADAVKVVRGAIDLTR